MLVDETWDETREANKNVQSFPSHHAERFFEKVLGSSPGLWAATAASYCPSSPGQGNSLKLF